MCCNLKGCISVIQNAMDYVRGSISIATTNNVASDIAPTYTIIAITATVVILMMIMII